MANPSQTIAVSSSPPHQEEVLSVVLAVLMVAALGVSMISCSNEEDDKKGESAELLPIPSISSYKVSDDFKIGMICLHDENSTYDLNFLNGAKAACAAGNFS